MTKVKMVSALLCDDIRREIDDMATIVGAKQSARIVDRDGRGQVDRLGLFLEFETEYPNSEKLQVRLHNREEDYSIFEQDVPLDLELPDDVPADADLRGVLVVASSKTDVEVEHPGEYFVEYRSGKGKWNTVRSYIFLPKAD